MAETIATTTLKASENIKLNPPTPFTGKQSDFMLFMQDVFIYLKVNKTTYDNDNKKISFILSYLTGGDAAVWKQQFIQTKIDESVTMKRALTRTTMNRIGDHTRNLLKPSRKLSNHMTSRLRPSRT
jgi:hypothetical protein